ncbi:hypothetical protein JTB14_019036 [Gonioctena quinquepunctata]|nr:hypothetical protein JTB14_019036 [Gonioctena quinquepunctata]
MHSILTHYGLKAPLTTKSTMSDDSGKKIGIYKRGVKSCIFPKVPQQLSSLVQQMEFYRILFTEVFIYIIYRWRGHQLANLFARFSV